MDRTNREAIALRNRVNEDAARWKIEKLDDELWSGTKLAQAVDLKKDRTFNQVLGGFSPEATRFIRESISLNERQAQEKEAQQRRELEQQKIQLAQERRARKLAQRITVGAAVGGMIVSGLVLFSGIQIRQSAIQQLETAVADSDSYLLNGQELKADVESIRAAKMLKAPLWQAIIPNRLKQSVLAQLQKTANSGHERNQFRSDGSELYDVFVSSDDSKIAIQEGFTSVRLLNADGSQVAQIANKGTYTYGEKFSPDGTRFVTSDGADSDSLYYLWDTNAGTELATLKDGEHILNNADIVFSSDSTRFTTVGENNTLYIWDANGKELATIEGYRQIQHSPDNTSIAALSEDGGIHLWNFNGEKIGSLQADRQKVDRYEFSPEGTRLAIFRENNVIDLWDFSNNEITALEKHEGANSDLPFKNFVAFNPEGTQLAAARENGTVLLWNSDGSAIATLNNLQGEVSKLEFSSAGDRLVAQINKNDKSAIHLWNADGSAIATLKSDEGQTKFFGFSSDGTRLISTGQGNTLLWDINGNQVATIEGSVNEYRQYEFSANGSRRLFTVGEDGTIRLWDLNGKQIAVLGQHQPKVVDSVLTSDGTQLVTSGSDGAVRFWETNSNAFPEIEGTHWIDFSPSGTQIAIKNEDYSLSLWDFEKMESIRLEDSSPVSDFAFSSDSKHLAAIEKDESVSIWNKNGSKVTTIENPQGEGLPHKLEFSADGTQIAIVTNNKSMEENSDAPMTVHLWNINGTKVDAFNDVPYGRVRGIAFNPDGVRLAIYGSLTGVDRVANIWNSADGKTITFEGHRGDVGGLELAPNGTQVTTTGEDDSTARLWDIKGNELAVFEGHQGDIHDFELSPDSRHLATAGSDGSLRLWDTAGNELATVEGLERAVTDIEFSPDGTQIATGGYDGTVRLWDLKGNELTRLESSHPERVLNIGFSPDGSWLTIHRDDKTVYRWKLDDADTLLSKQCDWVRDYLKISNDVEEADRTLCDDVAPLSSDK